MKNFLFIIFILIIGLIYFADSITKFGVQQVLLSNGIKISELSLHWEPSGLTIQELSAKQSDGVQDIRLHIIGMQLKPDISSLSYSVDIDKLAFTYKNCSESIEETRTDLPLQKLFGIGLTRFTAHSVSIDVYDCDYRVFLSLNSRMVVNSDQANVMIDGSIKLYEKLILLGESIIIAKCHLADNSLNYQMVLDRMQFDLEQSSYKMPLKIISGKVLLDGKTNSNLDTELEINYSDGKVVLKGVGLNNINSQNVVNWKNNGLFISSNINIDNIGAPVNSSNINVELVYQENKDKQIELKKMQMELADGQVSIAPVNINLSDVIEIKVKLDEVDLTKLAEAADIDGLKIEGEISGWINALYDDQKVQITNGVLQSSSDGGVLKYNPENKAMLTNIANYIKLPPEYWENFIYQGITIDIKMEKLKTVLHLRINGSNPKYFNNRTVNLNSKISLPIASLLQSWWIGEEIGLEKLKSIVK